MSLWVVAMDIYSLIFSLLLPKNALQSKCPLVKNPRDQLARYVGSPYFYLFKNLIQDYFFLLILAPMLQRIVVCFLILYDLINISILLLIYYSVHISFYAVHISLLFKCWISNLFNFFPYGSRFINTRDMKISVHCKRTHMYMYMNQITEKECRNFKYSNITAQYKSKLCL